MGNLKCPILALHHLYGAKLAMKEAQGWVNIGKLVAKLLPRPPSLTTSQWACREIYLRISFQELHQNLYAASASNNKMKVSILWPSCVLFQPHGNIHFKHRTNALKFCHNGVVNAAVKLHEYSLEYNVIISQGIGSQLKIHIYRYLF